MISVAPASTKCCSGKTCKAAGTKPGRTAEAQRTQRAQRDAKNKKGNRFLIFSVFSASLRPLRRFGFLIAAQCDLLCLGAFLGGANRRFDAGAIRANEEEVFVVAQMGD